MADPANRRKRALSPQPPQQSIVSPKRLRAPSRAISRRPSRSHPDLSVLHPTPASPKKSKRYPSSPATSRSETNLGASRIHSLRHSNLSGSTTAETTVTTNNPSATSANNKRLRKRISRSNSNLQFQPTAAKRTRSSQYPGTSRFSDSLPSSRNSSATPSSSSLHSTTSTPSTLSSIRSSTISSSLARLEVIAANTSHQNNSSFNRVSSSPEKTLPHKYHLRSRYTTGQITEAKSDPQLDLANKTFPGKLRSGKVSTNRNIRQPSKRELLALGASTSHLGERRGVSLTPEVSDTPRLTRGGAVIIRSTRQNKAHKNLTTGSCASSSSGGAGTASSCRGASTAVTATTLESNLQQSDGTNCSTTRTSLHHHKRGIHNVVNVEVGLVPLVNSATASTHGGGISGQHNVNVAQLLGASASHLATGTAAMAADHRPSHSHHGSELANSSSASLFTTDEPPSPQEATQAAIASAVAVGGAVSGGSGVSQHGGASAGIDSESDDSEVGRLQALLEARGLPPHLFGALGPRMQHILHRSMGASSSTAKAHALLPGLLATGDEGQQLQAVIEMCQLLVMGNEEILSGFPAKQVVPALITLLGMEHNFDIMNHACRALTYMMEALPRTTAVVVEAVPVFLEKLQVIQCMDVAEQSLTALDMLSRRHSKAILHLRGVSACLTYLDFFSISAQRNALSITANCCQNLSNEEFHFVQDSLGLLASRLTQQDKKCVESVCLAFSRLVESFQSEPQKLQDIASSAKLLTNLQQLLVVTPPVISTGTFITVLRMLSIMCANCPDLAVALLKQNIAETLLYLLTGSLEPKTPHSNTTTPTTRNGASKSVNPNTSLNQSDVEIELVPRQPQEQFEITAFIGELMPRLPTDGIFAVNTYLERPVSAIKDQATWHWRDDRGIWHPYGLVDSRIIESAHLGGDDEVSLNTLGRIYTIDFHTMQQINEDTGTSRPVQRRFTPNTPTDNVESNNSSTAANNSANSSTASNLSTSGGSTPGITQPSNTPSTSPQKNSRDARVACLREERGLAAAFIRSLFTVLYEVYSSSAGPAVRCKCLKALLRMVYYASPELLREVLKNQLVSSHIAGMMASHDLRIVVGALQMAEILMNKLPDEFGVHFRREGVMHQINRLADVETPLGVSPPKQSNGASACSSIIADERPRIHVVPTANLIQTPNGSLLASPSPIQPPQFNSPIFYAGIESVEVNPVTAPVIAQESASNRSASPAPHLRLTDVLKRKRGCKQRGQGSSAGPSTSGSTVPISSSGRSGAKKHQMLMQQQQQSTEMYLRSGSNFTLQGARLRYNASSSSAASSSSSMSNTPSSSKICFLNRFNPAKWGRLMNSTITPNSVNSSQASYHGSNRGCKDVNCTSNGQNINKSTSNSQLTACNREKTRAWIREQAAKFLKNYASYDENNQHSATKIISRINLAIEKLNTDHCREALLELRDILMESDISPFEINYSGLIGALIQFLAYDGPSESTCDRSQRLRIMLNVFAGCPLEKHSPFFNNNIFHELNPTWLSALVAKLNGCVSQLEQFPVKVHDLPASSGRSGSSALKFFNTHQLKCNLQRHPDCSNLKQWKGGTVKIDPLALVQAIERYLVVRGYGKIRDKESHDTDELDTDEDIEDTFAGVLISQPGARHKLQFLIGNTVLPYNMTVYQAVRQFSHNGNDQSETDTDNEAPLGNAGIWVQTHVIYYRPLREEPNTAAATSSSGSSSSSSRAYTNYCSNQQCNNPSGSAPNTIGPVPISNPAPHSNRKGKSSSSKSALRKKTDELWSDGITPTIQSPLTPFLCTQLPTSVTIQDASLQVLCLLRMLYGLNLYWNSLYENHIDYKQIIPTCEFLNSKIAAKAMRQLQDPLVIMTGNLPSWLQQIANVCPFLFPFETRQLLFYATCFDRDRALQRLLDMAPELSSSDSSERVTPRLDRRKRTISRNDILKQAEQVMQELASSKALLEIQYENEVGTGLGPTLEFYALVSKELQRCTLELWNTSDRKSMYSIVSNPNDVSRNSTNLSADNLFSEFLYTSVGLFPAALPRSAKVGLVTKMKSKFRFIGKFMAKAVMDSRMLDLPFSLTFYRWLLGQERCLCLADMRYVAPDIYKTIKRMQDILLEREVILAKVDLTADQKHKEIDKLTFDGCSISDLGIDFVMPGHPNFELIKGGKSMQLTAHNLDLYCKLVSHWMLFEGVQKQMDSLREGFESVFPLHHLRLFQPEELEAIFCGSPRDTLLGWDIKTLMECCRPDHGYTQDSRAIRFLFEVLASYDSEEQRMFVQFLTGSPRLPVGGFKALTPPLTVVRKTLELNMNPDDFLPSVMTCVNYLKLPDYSNIEVMRAKLKIAASEGQHSFYLS